MANILETYFSFERQVMATASFKTGASGSREIVTEVDEEVEEICIKFLWEKLMRGYISPKKGNRQMSGTMQPPFCY